ncbi:MAG: hypothetical protein HXY39_11995 [Chloroflexi bacterium]|nr:hypothetical protein [Chloroflexota bacterium]
MAATLATTSEIRQRLRPMARRLRLCDALWLASTSLWIAAGLSLLVQVAGRLWPIPYLFSISLVPVFIWLASIVAYFLFRPLTLHRVARRVDALLDSRERLATALELGERAEHAPLDELQRDDARAFAATLTPRLAPLRFHHRLLALALALMAAAMMLMVLPNPQDQVLAERAAVREAAQQAAVQIEQVRQELVQNQALSPEERAALDRELAELQQRLQQNPGNREEALADLSTTEARLQQRVTPDADVQRAALEQLARSLQAMSGQQQAGRPSLEQAEAGLQQLAQQVETMTPEEQARVAENLRQQAQQLQQSAPQTAQSLQQAADALEQNNTQQAQQSLNQAAQSVQQAQQQQASQQAAQQAISQLQQDRQSIAEAGQQPGQQQPGQQQPGQQQPGQQQPGQQDASQSSPETGRDAGTGSSDMIYQPYTPDGQPRDVERIQGQESQSGQTQVQQGQANVPGGVNASQVPFQQVLPEYQRAAGEALDQSAIPPHLKDYVRDYFSRLEPGQ